MSKEIQQKISAIEKKLLLVDIRLQETMEALLILITMNDVGSEQNNPVIYKNMQMHKVFWFATNRAFYHVIFLGVSSTLDKDPDGANFFEIIKTIESLSKSDNFSTINKELEAIKNKYSNFRNKIFAHNDLNRNKHIDRLNSTEFIYEDIRKDLNFLRNVYVKTYEINLELKMLHFVRGEVIIKTHQEFEFMNAWAIRDTTALLKTFS